MADARPQRRRRPSRRLKVAGQLGIAIALLLAVELLLRAVGFGGDAVEADPYVGFARSTPLFVPDDDGLHRVTAPSRHRHFNLQRFTEAKGEDVYRIVCLGGSTTYGRPYADATSFAGWLRSFLPVADDARRWEVINAGGVSYASYRVAAVLEECLAYEPDLFVIYTGHNEFLEERTYGDVRRTPQLLRDVGGLLGGTALFDAARSLLSPGPDPDARFELADEVSTILDGSVGPDAYVRDDALRAAVVEHLTLNLERMVRLARSAGAAVLLVTPASQLAGCAPFKSEHTPGLDAAAIARSEALLEQTTDPASLADPKRLALLADAAAQDPRHAALAYRLGMALLEAGDPDGARGPLERARDEDVVTLRAPRDVQNAIARVAAAEEVPLLDAVALTDALAAEHTGVPIAGPEVFLDHVHMTIEAYRRLALAILDELVALDVVRPGPGWGPDAVAAVTVSIEAELDTEAHVRALARLAAVLDWAGKRDEAAALTERSLELSGGGDAMSLWQRGVYLADAGDLDGAIASYREALAIDAGYAEAHYNLALLLLETGRLEEALGHFTATEGLDPTLAAAALGAGVALDALERRAAGRAAYDRVLALDPAHLDARNRKALSLLRDGRTDEAVAVLRAALDIDPDYVRARYNLAVVLPPEEAAVELRAVLVAEPDHVGALRRLGRWLAQSGEAGEGIALLERALELEPGDRALMQDVFALQETGRLPPDR